MKRAGLFAGALLLLWLAFQLLPSRATRDASQYPDTGTVASKPKAAPVLQPTRSSFKAGYAVAFLILAGGGAFAIYLRRRTGVSGAKSATIQTLGASQLAPGQQLRLVSCGGEVLLLGVTSTQINLLKSFPEEAFAQAAASHSADAASEASPEISAAAIGSSFASLLQYFGATPSAPVQKEEVAWPA